MCFISFKNCNYLNMGFFILNFINKGFRGMWFFRDIVSTLNTNPVFVPSNNSDMKTSLQFLCGGKTRM